MAIFDASGCEGKIGYVFNDKMLLRRCFTHSSYGYEHGEADNELLEFFGDAIIEFVITEYLYKNSSGDEGKLTKRRADIVSKEPLLRAVRELGIEEYVLLGHGQRKNSDYHEKLFSSIYEALVAGIYIDGGLASAKKFIKDTLIAVYEQDAKKEVKDKSSSIFKNEYQEYVQKRKLGNVSYRLISKIGPDHLPEFRVAALLNGTPVAEGKGGSKKQAEAVAAKSAVKKLKEQEGKQH